MAEMSAAKRRSEGAHVEAPRRAAGCGVVRERGPVREAVVQRRCELHAGAAVRAEQHARLHRPHRPLEPHLPRLDRLHAATQQGRGELGQPAHALAALESQMRAITQMDLAGLL